MEPTPKRKGRNSSRSSTSALEAKEDLARYAEEISMIKADLAFKSSNNEDDRESKISVLRALKLLILCNTGDVQKDVLIILNETKEEWIKNEIYSYLHEYIVQLICDCDLDEFAAFYSLWKNYDYEKFLEITRHSLTLLLGSSISEFLFDWTVPSLLGTQGHNKEFRMVAAEISNILAEYVDFKKLSEPVLKSFLLNLPSSINQLNKEDAELSKKYIDFVLQCVKLEIFDPNLDKTLKAILGKTPSKQVFVHHVKNYLLIEAITSNNNLKNFINLYTCWTRHDLPKFSEVLKDVIKKKTNILICKTFYLDTLIHSVMQPPSKEVTTATRDILIEIAFEFAAFLPISWWLAEEYDKFLKNVNGDNSYIKNILALATAKYENWHKLWMFLVRIFGKKLHKNMAVINSFLTVVEKAFRNAEISERLKGYDCWKELIDNVALEKNYISSSKQIKLLVTPLRAKFSRQESVITKRFDVFVYLLEKLQSNGVLVLKEFLEFCFGEVGENTDPNKAGGGKTVPQLWIKSAKVLMATIGHCHREKDRCLHSDDVIKLQNRMITQSNIASHYYHVLNSVAECSKLLKEVELDSYRHTILECLWRSTLNTVLSSQSEKRPQFLEVFGKILDDFLKQEDPYSNGISSIIFKVAMGMDPGKISDFVVNNLSHILKNLFTVPLQQECSTIEVEKLCLILFSTEKSEKTNQLKTDIFNAFTTFKTCETNVNFVAEIWVNLASELEDYSKGKSLDYLLWPALHLNHLEPSSKIKLDLVDSYRVLVSCYVEKQKDLHLGLFSSFAKVLKNNPLLAGNIMILIEMFSYDPHNLEILRQTLKIFSQILILPNLEGADFHSIKIIEEFLKKCLNSPEFAEIHDSEVVANFCKCMEYLFKSRHYAIVENLDKCIRSLTEDIKFLYSKHLSVDFFMDIFGKEKDINVTGKIYKVVDSLRNVKDPSVKEIKSPFPMGARSAKIAKLVKNTPEGSSGLRLFGKNVETLTPIKVKGSILSNSPKTPVMMTNKKKQSTPSKFSSPASKKNSLPSIMDESTSEFVPINTEVKIKPDMLTEHQKETMKKRREDIPALYEDLSQSQSQSITSLADLDKRKNTEGFKSPEEPKKSEKVMEILNELRTSSNNIEIVEESPKEPGNKNEKVINFSENMFTESEENIKESKFKNENQPLETELQEEIEEVSKKQSRMEAELKKLRMNIVGADTFFSPGRPKRIRKSLLPDKGEEATEAAGKKLDEKSEKKGRKKKHVDIESQNVETQNVEKSEQTLFVDAQNQTLPEVGIQMEAQEKSPDICLAATEEVKCEPNSKQLLLENERKSAKKKNKKSKHENADEKPVTTLKNTIEEVPMSTEKNLENDEIPVKRRKSLKGENTIEKIPKSTEKYLENKEIPAKRRRSLKSEKGDKIIKKPDKKLTVKSETDDKPSEPVPEEKKISDNLAIGTSKTKTEAGHKVSTEKAIGRLRNRPKKELSPNQEPKEEKISNNLDCPKDVVVSKKLMGTDSLMPDSKPENDKSNEILDSPKGTTSTKTNNKTRGIDSPIHHKSSINAEGIIRSQGRSKKEINSQEAKEENIKNNLESTKDIFVLKEMILMPDSKAENHEVNEVALSDNKSRKSRGASESPVPSSIEKKSSKNLLESPLMQEPQKSRKSRGASNSPVPSSVEKKSLRNLPKSPSIQEQQKAVKKINFEDKDKTIDKANSNENPPPEEKKPSKVPQELKNLKINLKGAEEYFSHSNNVSKRSRMIQNMAVTKDNNKKIMKCEDSSTDNKAPKKAKLTDVPKTLGVTKEEENKVMESVGKDTKSKLRGDISDEIPKSSIDEHLDLTTTKNKRKRPISDSDSEDMIESSQESTTTLNVLRSRSLSRVSGFLMNGSNCNSSLNQSDDSKTKRKSIGGNKEEKSSVESVVESENTVDKSISKEDSVDIAAAKFKPDTHTKSKKQEETKPALESPKRPFKAKSPVKNKGSSEKSLVYNMDDAFNKIGTIKKVLEVHLELMSTTSTPNNQITENQEKEISLKETNLDADILKQMREIHGDQGMDMTCQTQDIQTQDTQTQHSQTQDTQTQETQTKDTQTQDTQTQDTQTQDTQTQDTQTQDTESYDPRAEQHNSEETPGVLQLDLPEKPDLTDSEKLLARMDTETLTESDLNIMLDSSKDTSEGDKTTKPADISLQEPDCVKDTNNKNKNTNLDESQILNISQDTNKIIKDANLDNSEMFNIAKNISGVNKNISEIVGATQEAHIEPPIHTGSPNHSSDLPASPVTGDTPNRTSELLNSTSDISPIGSKSSSSFEEEKEGSKRLVPVALKFEDEELDLQPTEKSPEKADDVPEKPNSDGSPEKSETSNQNNLEGRKSDLKANLEECNMIEDSVPLLSDDIEIDNRIEVIKEQRSISDRSSKLFELVMESSVPHRFINKRKSSGPAMSPSASRIKKLMSNMKCATPTTAAENVNKEDILTFSREVPSPLAVPRSSILKRKHSECDEGGFSPATKRKRVNFSDPCTTARKIFIKDDNHAANLLNDEENISLHKELFGDTSDEICTETEGMESEQSCQVTNATLLRKDQAIYPDLVDCQADVIVIVKKVTSPMFVNNLLTKLKNKGITTIGDIASLSEAEVNRYPFKTPVVSNVYKALDDYFKKHESKLSTDSGVSAMRNSTDSDVESPLVQKTRKSSLVLPVQNVIDGSSCEVRRTSADGSGIEVLRKGSPRKKLMLIKEERMKIEEKQSLEEINEMTIEELGKLVISALETQNILDRVKGRVNIQIQDIIDHKNYPDALKEILKTLGVSQVLDIVTAFINGVSDQEAVYYNKMIENSTNQSLERFLQKRTLDEVQKSLWKCVEDGTFNKEEVLTTVFIPHLNVAHLNPIFDALTDVDVENAVLNRLKGENSTSFVLRIIEKHHINTCQVVSKLNLEELTPEDNVTAISRLLKVDTLRENHLIDIFEVVSKTLASRLPANVLMNLATQLLRKIPLKD